MEYKKTVLAEMSTLLPEYRKTQYDQTAQCVVNFLNNEVQSLLRITPVEETPTANSNLLSETVIQDLDASMLTEHDQSDSETDGDDQLELVENSQLNSPASGSPGTFSTNLNDSLTLLKEVANTEQTQSQRSKAKSASKKQATNKPNQCCDSCKVKPSSKKKKYDMIRCTFCMHWYHETCVGIKKDDPIGIWVCMTCRNVPIDMKQDIRDLKHEVCEIKQSTKSILKAIENISSKLANSLENVNDRITSVSRQINSKELCITESLESLQTVTSGLKTSLDQKSCQIINKTTAVFEKVKAHEENFKNLKVTPNHPMSQQTNIPNKPQTQPSKSDMKNPKNNANPNNTQSKRIRKPVEETQNSSSKRKSQRGRELNSYSESHSTSEEHETIDLTNRPTKVIHNPTLLVGSSILKRIKISNLNPNVAIKTFPGATVTSIKDKLDDYDISKCNTIILHVGGNDADSITNIETFCDNYVSLLESLQTDDRRLVVSGLLPRASVDLEPYTNKLKAICAENDLEYIDHFDGFLLASGEIPETYFDEDKTHLNMSGTRKFLTNIDSVCKVRNISNLATHNERASRTVRSYQGPRRGRGPPPRRGPSSQKYCHICTMNNHTTTECWFNGRNSGMQGTFSR